MYVCSQAIVVPKGIFVPKIEANIFNTHLCEKIQEIVVPKIEASVFNCLNFGYTLLGTHTQNLGTHSKKIRAIVLEYSGIGGRQFQ